MQTMPQSQAMSADILDWKQLAHLFRCNGMFSGRQKPHVQLVPVTYCSYSSMKPFFRLPVRCGYRAAQACCRLASTIGF